MCINYTKKQSLLAVILVAFFAQAFIAQGYMPGKSDKGTFEIVICTIYGLETRTVTVDTAPAPGHGGGEQDHKRDTLCAFSLAAINFIDPAIGSAGHELLLYHRLAAFFPSDRIIAGEASRSQYATGPPTLS